MTHSFNLVPLGILPTACNIHDFTFLAMYDIYCTFLNRSITVDSNMY